MTTGLRRGRVLDPVGGWLGHMARAARLRRRLSAEEAAAKLARSLGIDDISASAIYGWETGGRRPDRPIAEIYATEVLRCALSSLVLEPRKKHGSRCKVRATPNA